MNPLCAICAKRPAVVRTAWDNGDVPSCKECDEGPVRAFTLPEDSAPTKVLRFLRFNPNATLGDIALHGFGIDSADADPLVYDTISQALRRYVKLGKIVRTRVKGYVSTYALAQEKSRAA